MTVPFWAVPLRVIAVLEELGIPYAVGGSFASSIHGIPRQTRDLDLAAELEMAHAAPLWERLRNDFYIELESIVRAIERRTRFNAIHLATAFKVDVFVSPRGAFDLSEMARAAPHLLGAGAPRRVQVGSAEDTLLRKLAWYRLGGEVSDRQWQDILGIVRTQADRLDLSYLRTWAPSLGIADLLERALG